MSAPRRRAARPSASLLFAVLVITELVTSGCSVRGITGSRPADEVTGASELETNAGQAPTAGRETSGGSNQLQRDSANLAGPPLPAGATFEPAGSVAPSNNSTTEPEPTLRPDDRSPQERVGDIVKRGRLIVGVDQSHNLLSYRDTSTGEIKGFEVDLAHEIARDIFGDPNKVDFRFVEYGERQKSLEERKVDIVINTLTQTPERQRRIDFSLPYLSVNTRMLVMSSSGIVNTDQTAGRTLCATRESTALDKIRQFAPMSNILATGSWGDCLMALQLGQIDGIVTDDAILSGMLAQDPYTSIVGDTIAQENYGIGVRRSSAGDDSSGLLRQVNSTMERIRRDGTWAKLYSAWFGDYLSPRSLPEPVYRDEKDEKEDAANHG